MADSSSPILSCDGTGTRMRWHQKEHAKPEEEHTKPEEEHAKPREEHAKPGQEHAKPGEEITTEQTPTHPPTHNLRFLGSEAMELHRR